MEQYASGLDELLDGDLVDALDDNLGQKAEDNHKEKFRYTYPFLVGQTPFGVILRSYTVYRVEC